MLPHQGAYINPCYITDSFDFRIASTCLSKLFFSLSAVKLPGMQYFFLAFSAKKQITVLKVNDPLIHYHQFHIDLWVIWERCAGWLQRMQTFCSKAVPNVNLQLELPAADELNPDEVRCLFICADSFSASAAPNFHMECFR